MAFESQQPRDLLARGAIQLFAARGYAAVTVQEIVEAASVTKPTLYHHFGNKLGLLRTILQEEFAAMAVRISAAAAYRGDLKSALEAAAGAYFESSDDNPAFYRLLLLLWFCPQDSEERGASVSHFQCQQAMFERLFLDAARDHGNMIGRHQAYAATFLGMVNAYIGLRMKRPPADRSQGLGLRPDLSADPGGLRVHGLRARPLRSSGRWLGGLP